MSDPEQNEADPPPSPIFGGRDNFNILADEVTISHHSTAEAPMESRKPCPACGAELWAHAGHCHRCGFDFHRRWRIAYRAALLLLLAVIAAMETIAALRG